MCNSFESTERMKEKQKQKLHKTRMQSEVKSQVTSKRFSSTMLIEKNNLFSRDNFLLIFMK